MNTLRGVPVVLLGMDQPNNQGWVSYPRLVSKGLEQWESDGLSNLHNETRVPRQLKTLVVVSWDFE